MQKTIKDYKEMQEMTHFGDKIEYIEDKIRTVLLENV